jgi:carbonic anhydrase
MPDELLQRLQRFQTDAFSPHRSQWLELGRETALPVAEPGPDVLRRIEQRAVVLQLNRPYPMVRERVEAGTLALHGWHYVIEDGEVHVFDVQRGGFVPAAQADNAGTGPYLAHPPEARRDDKSTRL